MPYLSHKEIWQIISVFPSRVFEVHRNTHYCHCWSEATHTHLKLKPGLFLIRNLQGLNHSFIKNCFQKKTCFQFKSLNFTVAVVFSYAFIFWLFIDSEPLALEKKTSILTLLVLLFIFILKSNKDNLPSPRLSNSLRAESISHMDQMPNNLICLKCHQGNISKA